MGNIGSPMLCMSMQPTECRLLSSYFSSLPLLQLQGTGVHVSIGFPADMDTPCYKEEELIKV